MTVCDCKCHQDASIKSGCIKCANTGIMIPGFTMASLVPVILQPIGTKPIYTKGSKDLSHAVPLSSVTVA